MKTTSLPETKFRRSVDTRMVNKWVFTWHEDREISPGVPDLHYVMRSDHGFVYRVGWLELKAVDLNLTPSKRIHVEPSQHQYCRKWTPHMPIHFLVRVQERVFLIPGQLSPHISAANCRADLAVLAIAQFDEEDMEFELPNLLRDITRI